ncbi:MAG: Mammalian cell entry related domain protein [Phenylobacterium sp.]|jgi:phospholipid/cholesterol/gamma-HCH transport system substrate-binding protein|nr:Mammalian cell entry related domain protein [Phenylobacterium sp.]
MMKDMARSQLAEAAVGAVVLGIAAWFLIYSLSIGGVGHQTDRYEVSARFGEVGSLAPGAAVRVAGVQIGAVSKVDLDPKTFLAKAHMELDRNVKLPADSTAKIASDGLLGGAHVVISPGSATENLKAGGEIENTQGAVDLFGLVGQMMRPPAQPSAPSTRDAAH